MRAKKLTITLFSGAFSSEINGAAVRSLLSDLNDEARKALGEASDLRIAVQTDSRTPNARLKLRMFETAGPRRPTALGAGYPAFWTGPDMDTPAPTPATIAGPFCTNIDMALDVSASSGTAQETWQGTISATAFFN
jgi:hypothetical protein